MSMKIDSGHTGAGATETELCHVPITTEHLSRFAEVAFEDMNRFFQQRPELEQHRFCVILGLEAASHYLFGSGFRCISVYTFFKKVDGCKDFHPLRHTRVDFGSDVFGQSSWKKHPGDQGFTGRGINCYGRSIRYDEVEETPAEAVTRYLKEGKSAGAKMLNHHGVVVLWPPNHFAEEL